MAGYGRSLHEEVRQFLSELVHAVPLDELGGSGVVKALVIGDLMVRNPIYATIEIGVYRGRSLLPVATMLRVLGRGKAIGIDPWSADAALQSDAHEVDAAVNERVRQHPWEE